MAPTLRWVQLCRDRVVTIVGGRPGGCDGGCDGWRTRGETHDQQCHMSHRGRPARDVDAIYSSLNGFRMRGFEVHVERRTSRLRFFSYTCCKFCYVVLRRQLFTFRCNGGLFRFSLPMFTVLPMCLSTHLRWRPSSNGKYRAIFAVWTNVARDQRAGNAFTRTNVSSYSYKPVPTAV